MLNSVNHNSALSFQAFKVQPKEKTNNVTPVDQLRLDMHNALTAAKK